MRTRVAGSVFSIGRERRAVPEARQHGVTAACGRPAAVTSPRLAAGAENRVTAPEERLK